MTRLLLALALALAAPLAFPQTNEQDTREFLARTAFDPLPGSPEQMQDLLKTDSARWKGYVELAKIQPQ